MRTHLLLLLSLTLAACGSDDKTTADAATSQLTCATYCSTIAAACTGTNQQFGGGSADDVTAHCMGTCAAFSDSAAQTGDTLGCHVYHAMNAMAGGPATHCPHAGPAGDAIGMAGICGDPCTNFCTLVQKTCGVKGTDANGQYTDMNDCMNACSGFDTTTKYIVDTTTFPSKNPTGNNLACRIYHATNAAVSAAQAATHCKHTAVMSDACKPPAPIVEGSAR